LILAAVIPANVIQIAFPIQQTVAIVAYAHEVLQEETVKKI
jgi:hypothetical protein